MSFISENGINSTQSRCAKSAMHAFRALHNLSTTLSILTSYNSETVAFVLSLDSNPYKKTSPLSSKSKSMSMLQRNPKNPEMIEFSMYILKHHHTEPTDSLLGISSDYIKQVSTNWSLCLPLHICEKLCNPYAKNTSFNNKCAENISLA